jgi:hypothetical protein
MKSRFCWSLTFALIVMLTFLRTQPVAAQIQVDSTNPSAAPQGTVNLNVTISGSGFKRGAVAHWYVTGTTDPGGVIVNSTTVNGSSKITANITVALDAVTSGFDVVVQNSDGRTGKGTDAFTVTTKGTPLNCWTTGTPSGFTLQAVLNPVQPNGVALITTGKLGNTIRIRPLDLNKDGVVDSLAAFVTSGTSSGANPGTYVFFLDPVTGRPQANNPLSGAVWQNPLLVLSGVRATHATAGDANGDGVPDFAGSSPEDGSAYVFVGAVSGSPSYTPSYTAYRFLPPPDSPTDWGVGTAMGDLDGDGKDEIAIGAVPGKRDTHVPAVFIFKYTGSGVTLWQKIQDPTGSVSSSFSFRAIAIGNVDGTPGNDLVVGAKGASTPNGGAVYVFPAPLRQSSYFMLTGPPGGGFGEGVGVADVNLDGFPDLVVNTGAQFSGSGTSAQTLIFAGIVHAGAVYTNQLLPANGNLAYSWAAPNWDLGDMQSGGAVAIGTPNATNNNGCSIQGGVGTVQLFTSPFASSQQPSYVFEPPTLAGSNQFQYGYGVGVTPGYPFVLVGAHFMDVGTTSVAGQVFVYKKN